MDKIISKLAKKHKLDKIDTRRLNSELELTKLRTEYALYRMKTDNMTLFDSLAKFSALKRYTWHLSESEFAKIEDKIKSIKRLNKDKLAEYLFMNFLKTKRILEHKKHRMCFDYDVYKENRAMLHFRNAVVPKHPFEGNELENRKNDMRVIAKLIKTKRPNIEYMFSISWIWHLKMFKDLMPKSFVKSLDPEPKTRFYSDGWWGQFMRYDGSLNKERIKEFKKDWKFPLMPLWGKCDIEDFFEMYV